MNYYINKLDKIYIFSHVYRSFHLYGIYLFYLYSSLLFFFPYMVFIFFYLYLIWEEDLQVYLD